MKISRGAKGYWGDFGFSWPELDADAALAAGWDWQIQACTSLILDWED